ncbi:class II aldolase/adducin family protein [bacterium]|nr:class II aldolase/adducin family protein [bacterium]
MLEKLKQNLIDYGMLAGERGYTPGISGNISARFQDKIIITSSGSANGFLSMEDFSLIDFDGNVLEGNPKPSSEKFLHIEFYKKRKDVNAIFHFHSPYLTAFSASGMALTDGILPEIIYCYDGIPLADYALPGSEDLVLKTSQYFDKYDIVLMKNHGVIVGSDTVKNAFLHLETAEYYAKTVICAKILGGAKILSEDEIKKIKNLRKISKSD